MRYREQMVVAIASCFVNRSDRLKLYTNVIVL